MLTIKLIILINFRFICYQICNFNIKKNIENTIRLYNFYSKKKRSISADFAYSIDFARDNIIFKCSNTRQNPYVINNHNIFCNIEQQSYCPKKYLDFFLVLIRLFFFSTSCQLAINSPNIYICCYDFQTITPLCPLGSIPQLSLAGFVFCDFLQINQCLKGYIIYKINFFKYILSYICVPAINNHSVSLCCLSKTIKRLVCPNQQLLFLVFLNFLYFNLFI